MLPKTIQINKNSYDVKPYTGCELSRNGKIIASATGSDEYEALENAKAIIKNKTETDKQDNSPFKPSEIIGLIIPVIPEGDCEKPNKTE